MKRDHDLSEASVNNFKGVFKEIVDAIGEEDAAALIKQYGGTRICVPSRIPDGHRLAVLLGKQTAQKLCSCFGNSEFFEIPLDAAGKRARRNAQIYADREKNISVSKIARRYLMTERSIRMIFAKRQKPESTKQKSVDKPIKTSI